MTAPTGTSPASRASRASASAISIHAGSSITLGADGLACRLVGELQAAVTVGPRDERIAVAESSLEHRHRQWVLDQTLDRTLQRSRSECRVVAFFGQKTLGLR